MDGAVGGGDGEGGQAGKGCAGAMNKELQGQLGHHLAGGNTYMSRDLESRGHQCHKNANNRLYNKNRREQLVE